MIKNKSMATQVPGKCWAVVPAAGVGKRMRTSIPKQYLKIKNKSILALTLEKLLSSSLFEGVVVALSENDEYFASLPESLRAAVIPVQGGEERADSVLSGLEYLAREGGVSADSWVMVHDAARPCVSLASLKHLYDAVTTCGVGGILAVPVADTLKKVDGQSIVNTFSREGVWQANTPQMFQLGELNSSLKSALGSRVSITDEASAIESAGLRSIVVPDRRDNIKITLPDDLPLAELILQSQGVFEA